MFKNILRFLIITLIAFALGFGIYHLLQPSGIATFRSGIGDFGGEGGFREGGFNLTRGLFGVTGNLMLVAIITVIVVSIQKLFPRKPEPVTIR